MKGVLNIKTIYLILGLLFIFLGAIGIFLPVWPTTPFVLVSIFFFSRSNKDFEEYILNNKWIGTHIRNYIETKSMNRDFKIKTLLFLWLGLLISMLFQSNWIVIGILALVGVLVTIHISLLKNTDPK